MLVAMRFERIKVWLAERMAGCSRDVPRMKPTAYVEPVQKYEFALVPVDPLPALDVLVLPADRRRFEEEAPNLHERVVEAFAPLVQQPPPAIRREARRGQESERLNSATGRFDYNTCFLPSFGGGDPQTRRMPARVVWQGPAHAGLYTLYIRRDGQACMFLKLALPSGHWLVRETVLHRRREEDYTPPPAGQLTYSNCTWRLWPSATRKQCRLHLWEDSALYKRVLRLARGFIRQQVRRESQEEGGEDEDEIVIDE